MENIAENETEISGIGLLKKAEEFLARMGLASNDLSSFETKSPSHRYNANDAESFDAGYVDVGLQVDENPILELEALEEIEETAEIESLSEWAKDKKVQMCGVLAENYGYFVMKDMYGLHAQTAVTSLASLDFWTGTLESTGEWEIFTEDDMNISPFYQLFSDEDRYNIKRICVLPKNIMNQHVIAFFASSDPFKGLTLPSPNDEDFTNALKKSVQEFKSPYENRETIEKYLKHGFLRYEASCFILSVKIAIDNIVQQCETSNEDIRQAIYNTIYNSIAMAVQKNFCYPNCITKGIEGEIKIAIFSNGKIDEELLKMQLDPSIKEILCDDAQGAILISADTAVDFDAAQKFLF